jgi:catecholate siderophore receptor
MHKRLTISLSLAVSLASTQLALGATTAPAEDTIEQVLVRGAYFGQPVASGAKTPTLLVNVPQSISIMSADQMQDQAMTSIAEVMQYTPGVSIGQGEDHRDQITLRGQNTTADFFVDGLRDDVQYFRPLYNLERVEILRGSNALLFGRGGGGGVVNRVTKVADTQHSFTTVGANVDSFGATLATVDTNVRISDYQALRINGMLQGIENHRDFKDGERWAINPTYTLKLADSTQVVASWETIDDDRIVDRGVPSINGRPVTGFTETFFGDPNLNQATFEGDIVRLRLDHRFSSNWTSNATVQWADYDKYYENLYPIGFSDIDSSVALDGYYDAQARENLLAQINLVGQFDWLGLGHTVLAGIETGKQKTDNERADVRFFDSNDDQITLGFSDPLVIPGYEFTAPVRDRDSEVTSSSAFLQDEIALNEHWIVVAGTRIDRFEIDVVDAIEINNGIDDGNDGFLSSSDTEVSPRAGLIYKPSEDLSFYLSYSKSFLPRSGDQFLTLTPTTASLAPEQFENQEVGFKWNIADNFSLAASLFEITRDNGTAVDPNDPERSVLTGTETRGLELQVMGTPTDRLSVNASYSFLEGEELGQFDNGVADNQDLAQLPRHKVTLWADYTLNSQWRGGFGVVHQAEQYATLSNAVTLPSFTRVDAALFWDATNELSLQLNAENLLDEDYFPDSHNDNNISVGRPFNVVVGATYRF